jgi:Leucine-rich repeat (LRR) protein
MDITNIKEINESNLLHEYRLSFRDENCTIEQIQAVLGKCGDSLREVSINSPNLSRFPENLERLINLQYLSFVTKVSLDIDNIEHCTGLQSLYLESEDLTCSTEKSFPFKNLQSIGLNCYSLRNIPKCILTENLHTLSVNSMKLESFSGELTTLLKGLNNLSINAPIRHLGSLQHCDNLCYLSLHGTLLQNLDGVSDFPDSLISLLLESNSLLNGKIEIGHLKKLETLQFYASNTEFIPTGTGNCKQLKQLVLSNVSFLPDEIQECSSLISLKVDGGTINTLPVWIVNMTQLKGISINNTRLKNIPNDWGKMTSLEGLSLYSNRIEDLLFVYSIPNLKYVHAYNNPIKDKLFMLEGTKIFPGYCSEWFRFQALEEKDISSFMSALGKSGLSREDKEWFFYQFNEKSKMSIPTDWDSFRFFQGLTVPYKLLNEKINKKLLETQLNRQSLHSFKAGSICYLSGSFTEKKSVIKEKLSTLGIKISNDLNVHTTHIIIGKKPKDVIEFVKDKEVDFLLEQQLYQAIKNIGDEEKFLVQEERAGEDQMVEGVKQLLGSSDINSVIIGLEMLKSGGIPDGINDELLLLCKTYDDAKIRSEAKKILEIRGIAEWVGVLKDKQTFTNIKSMKEKEVRDKLQKMAVTVSKNQVFKFAMLLFKYHQKGIPFVLANFPIDSLQRKEALIALTDRSNFNFHRGVGYHNWKNQKPEEIILSSVNTGIKFPSDFPHPELITSINMHNCKFDTLSKSIEIFENVEELDLSVNNLKSIPLNLAKLTKLKVLNLSSNRLTGFPMAVESLPELRLLDLRFNSASAFKSGDVSAIEIPQSFLEKNSKCEVLI